jgi:Domain of unknown function (DUF4249)
MNKILLFLILVIAATSCRKVITVKLDTAASRIVIEGAIYNQAGPYFVRITKSGSYFDTTRLPVINNASVIIKDNTGITDTLRYTNNGIYQTRRTRGVAGRTYTITVKAEGNEYKAESTMPASVSIDSLTYEYASSLGLGNNKPGYKIFTYYKEPGATVNYYQLNIYKNDSLINDDGGYFLLDDNFTNGKNQKEEFVSDRLKAKDTVTAELLSLSKSHYDYLRTLSDIVYNGGFSAAPANPISNWNNNALGFFAAYSAQHKETILK